MKALTWQGKRSVSVEEVPDPRIQEPTDAIVRITSTGICGSDLHLYEVLGPFMDKGDIIGHEPMGIVEEVGPAVTHIKAGDRVVITGHRAREADTLAFKGETITVNGKTYDVYPQREKSLRPS